jgi:hypothetical protein
LCVGRELARCVHNNVASFYPALFHYTDKLHTTLFPAAPLAVRLTYLIVVLGSVLSPLTAATSRCRIKRRTLSRWARKNRGKLTFAAISLRRCGVVRRTSGRTYVVVGDTLPLKRFSLFLPIKRQKKLRFYDLAPLKNARASYPISL